MTTKGVEVRPVLRNDNPNTRSQFFNLYNREADEYDKVFLKKYDGDLNTTLIFAGLFSAVTSAFIINVETSLQPDNTATTVALMKILIHTIDNSTFAGMDLTLPQWTGPDENIIAVQTLLYSSLAATLIAAFIAMLGKQWINRYEQRKRGTIEERSRDRQQKLDGIESWKFHVIMECLPLMLQWALLLLGIALSRYIWGINKTIAAVIIAVTSLSILFYVFIVISAAIYYYCPFQTPFSFLLHYLIKIVYRKSRSSSWPSWLELHDNPYLQPALDLVYSSIRTVKLWLIQSFAHSSTPATRPSVDVTPLFGDLEVDLAGNRLDARCVMWMRETSTDPDVTIAAMQFISEVEWNADVDAISSLIQLATQVHEYCDLMASYPSTIASTRDKTYDAAKAFLHLYVQRRCVDKREVSQIKDFDYLGLHVDEWDNDLESTLWMIDHIVEGHFRIVWSGFGKNTKISTPHISWACHILLYRLWASNLDEITDIGCLDNLLECFWSHSASLSLSTIADCILICALTLGLRIHVRDLSVKDKGREMSTIINKLFHLLNEAFHPTTPRENTTRALKALRMLTLWKGRERTEYIKIKPTIKLCQTILDSVVEDDLKWDAARMVMQIGFRDIRSDGFYAGSAKACVTFLEHHLTKEPNHYDSIADAFQALSFIYPIIIDDFSQGNLAIRGICWALKSRRPTRLAATALQFVHRMRYFVFETNNLDPFIDQDFSSALKATWDGLVLADNSDAVHTSRFLKILGNMSYTPAWHPYLLRDHWDAFDREIPEENNWLFSLLEGNYARKTLGWKAAAECIRISWKHCFYSDRDELFGLVHRTINLLVMNGRPAIHMVAKEIDNALRAVEADQKNTDTNPADVEFKLVVLKEVVKFLQDVKIHVPYGWEGLVIAKANVRRRKVVQRFRRRQELLIPFIPNVTNSLTPVQT